MAFYNPFYKRTSRTRTAWDYTFELTDDHLTPETMSPLKYSYDTLGEAAYIRLTELAAAAKTTAAKTASPPTPTDLYTLLEAHHTSDPILSALWDQASTVPAWVDWDQLARGQPLLYRYGGAILTGLAYNSLLGGLGAERIVETLARTGGFSQRVVRRRLYETTQHILQVTRSLEGIKPGGEGWVATLRVRLLHAAVRARIRALAKARQGYYDEEVNGVPINDLDSLATIASFSATLIWVALPRQGIFIRRQEAEDYVALWRWIAWVIGCPDTRHFATPEGARMFLESMLLYEVHPSPTSRVLADNLLNSLAGAPPAHVSRGMLVASARWLNGGDLCDALGLEKASLYYKALMAGQCVFYVVMSYPTWVVPGLDERKCRWMRDVFWNMIVVSKSGLGGRVTGFEFKYVPEEDTVERQGREVKEKETTELELRNLKWLGVGVVVLVLIGWVWYRMFVKAMEMVGLW
ncbi:hypothetical protein EJ06DRAFT_493876 [Trichodelitschia bisporula]|uniref:ER-bound oxygenase mpaB/mpaB'/Rubber oxygenase catalytic domain-containing protein n=1 Tax=Trichodelitschia bisporula TaxID=703511 RepID=A0A6G1HWE0_9PEZI|nr:hypothetical protein EJ06DRAFT_493876 [Trichodelitschia bisporula]